MTEHLQNCQIVQAQRVYTHISLHIIIILYICGLIIYGRACAGHVPQPTCSSKGVCKQVANNVWHDLQFACTPWHMWHIYMYVRMFTRKLLTIHYTMQKTLCMVGSRWNQSMNYWSLKRKFFLSTNIGGVSELQLSHHHWWTTRQDHNVLRLTQSPS